MCLCSQKMCGSLIHASVWSISLWCRPKHSSLCIHHASGAPTACTGLSTWGAGSGSLGRCCSRSAEEGPPSNGMNRPPTYLLTEKLCPCVIDVCWGQWGALVAPRHQNLLSLLLGLTDGTAWVCSPSGKIAGRWASGPCSLALCSNVLPQEGLCPRWLIRACIDLLHLL